MWEAPEPLYFRSANRKTSSSAAWFSLRVQYKFGTWSGLDDYVMTTLSRRKRMFTRPQPFWNPKSLTAGLRSFRGCGNNKHGWIVDFLESHGFSRHRRRTATWTIPFMHRSKAMPTLLWLHRNDDKAQMIT